MQEITTLTRPNQSKFAKIINLLLVWVLCDPLTLYNILTYKTFYIDFMAVPVISHEGGFKAVLN